MEWKVDPGRDGEKCWEKIWERNCREDARDRSRWRRMLWEGHTGKNNLVKINSCCCCVLLLLLLGNYWFLAQARQFCVTNLLWQVRRYHCCWIRLLSCFLSRLGGFSLVLKGVATLLRGNPIWIRSHCFASAFRLEGGWHTFCEEHNGSVQSSKATVLQNCDYHMIFGPELAWITWSEWCGHRHLCCRPLQAECDSSWNGCGQRLNNHRFHYPVYMNMCFEK